MYTFIRTIDILKSMKWSNSLRIVRMLIVVCLVGCRDDDSQVTHDLNSSDVDFSDVNSTDSLVHSDTDAVSDHSNGSSDDADAQQPTTKADQQSIEEPSKEPPKELTETEKVEQWLESVSVYTTKECVNDQGKAIVAS